MQHTSMSKMRANSTHFRGFSNGSVFQGPQEFAGQKFVYLEDARSTGTLAGQKFNMKQELDLPNQLDLRDARVTFSTNLSFLKNRKIQDDSESLGRTYLSPKDKAIKRQMQDTEQLQMLSDSE